MSTPVREGVCKYCKCTEDNACRLPTGEPCCWFNRLRTLCNAPACLAAQAAADQRFALELLQRRRAATRAPSPWQIRKQRRMGRRRRNTRKKAA